jgi:hypothetical protein
VSTESRPATLRNQQWEDDEGVVSLFRTIYPMFPHGTVDDYRFRIRSWEKYGREFRQWVAELDGRIAGCALLLEIKSTEPVCTGAKSGFCTSTVGED